MSNTKDDLAERFARLILDHVYVDCGEDTGVHDPAAAMDAVIAWLIEHAPDRVSAPAVPFPFTELPPGCDLLWRALQHCAYGGRVSIVHDSITLLPPGGKR